MSEIKDKKELKKICEAEFEVFSEAIKKMGFDPPGFVFAFLLDKSIFTREFLDSFHLEETQKIAVDNRIKLLSNDFKS